MKPGSLYGGLVMTGRAAGRQTSAPMGGTLSRNSTSIGISYPAQKPFRQYLGAQYSVLYGTVNIVQFRFHRKQSEISNVYEE